MKQKKDRTFTVRFTEEQFRRIQEQADTVSYTHLDVYKRQDFEHRHMVYVLICNTDY